MASRTSGLKSLLALLLGALLFKPGHIFVSRRVGSKQDHDERSVSDFLSEMIGDPQSAALAQVLLGALEIVLHFHFETADLVKLNSQIDNTERARLLHRRLKLKPSDRGQGPSEALIYSRLVA